MIGKLIDKISKLFKLSSSTYYITGSENLLPPLSKEEEDILVEKYNQTGYIESRNKLIEHNLRLVVYVAKRFAAKEAVAKALGTGFRDGIYLSDIEIISDELGKPFAELKGNALKRAKQYGIKKVHLSLSDDYPFVSAMAVAEG